MPFSLKRDLQPESQIAEPLAAGFERFVQKADGSIVHQIGSASGDPVNVSGVSGDTIPPRLRLLNIIRVEENFGSFQVTKAHDDGRTWTVTRSGNIYQVSYTALSGEADVPTDPVVPVRATAQLVSASSSQSCRVNKGGPPRTFSVNFAADPGSQVTFDLYIY